MSPRTYQMSRRDTASHKTRERILAATRNLLLAKDFSGFTMDAVARQADVSRLTVYYQFKSKARLLDALYDYIAKRGDMQELAEVFRQGNHALQILRGFINVFARFWASDRDVIRRLHALGEIDSEIREGLRARNERRRNGLRVIVERYCRMYLALTPPAIPVAIDTLHMLTSFETFDALTAEGRSIDDVTEIIRKLAYQILRVTP